MKSKRTEKIVVHLEPQFYVALKRIMDEENLSASAAGRKAVIHYLKDCGLITDATIAEIVC